MAGRAGRIAPAAPAARRLLRWAVEVREEEVRALLWAFAYFFSILCAYAILRPLRDEMGIAGGIRALPWLFTGTFVVMLAVVPLFGALVARFPRSRFIPFVYWFFILNLLAFWALLLADVGRTYVARAFFIWTSVFNLFVVSVFWSFMADLFRNDQGRRLFGFIAAGGTAGTLIGPLLTVVLVVPLRPIHLLLVSAGFLLLALLCVRELLRLFRRPEAPASPSSGPGEGDGGGPDRAIGGGILSGLTEVASSPYLLAICFFMLLYTTTSTVLYFEQAHIVRSAFRTSAQRTQVFAFMDLGVSALTILVQLFVTGRLIRRFGVGLALGLVTLITLAGFSLLALFPTISFLVAFQILRRASNFAVSRPGREILFTVVSPDQKYKAKNFIDTVVYRGGDAVSGWAFAGLSSGLGLGVAAIAALCIPLAAVWSALAWHLGRRQEALAKRQELME